MANLRVEKRNGKIVDFEPDKIEIAIQKAMKEESENIDKKLAKKISNDTFENFKDKEVVNIEQIQDFVEIELMKTVPRVAKRYIIYRQRRAELRKHGWDMTDLQRDIYESKYQFDGENFSSFLDRISGGNSRIEKLIRDKKFMPAGRILAGRGLDKLGRKITLSNCYVMPKVQDNIESIFDTAKWMARTYSYGGGVGINISDLRPAGAKVNNAALTTTGAVSFMDLYSMTTGLIGMRGRRGALMINLDVDHPDIEEFIGVKNDLSKVNFANISVNITDEFMKAVEKGEDFTLRFENKANDEIITKKVDARALFRKISENNWNMAEPGVLFKDKINSYHLMSEDEDFEYAGVNPCAEEPLPAFGACNLSSINLSEYVLRPFTENAELNIEGLKEAVRCGVVYLNEILDENIPLHPLKEQRETSENLRQIGLGIMGLADMFIKLDIRYGSQESLDLIEKLGHIIINEALQESALLAKEDGSFPYYKKEAVLSSEFIKSVATDETVKMIEQYGLRNSQTLTIAPTGSISTLIGASNGVEPIFQISYTRKTESINQGQETYYKVITPIIKEYMEAKGIKHEEDLPDTIVTTSSLDYKDRVNVQAAWQKYIDASISSTVNLPEEASVDEVEDLYFYAWKKGLKGITIYRDGCARAGILITNKTEKKSKPETPQEIIQDLQKQMDELILGQLQDNPDMCPKCGGKLNHSGGCSECQDCGYSPCAI